MTATPAKLTARRAELERYAEAHQASIRIHESELRADRAELHAILEKLAELDSCPPKEPR